MKKRHMISPEFFQRLIWGPLRAFMIVFCSLEVKGDENIKSLEKNMIIASNHQSELDPLLIVACLPFFCRQFPIIYVTREKKLYAHPGWSKWKQFLYGGTFFKIIGGYPSYGGLKNYKQALSHHINSLNIGNNVGIFPTGKITTNGESVKAKGGVSFLAQHSKAPIIPVFIQGLENLTLKNAIYGKMKVTVIFGRPLYLKDIVLNPNKMIISDELNDYEIAAAKIWKHIERLSHEDDLTNSYSITK